MQLQKNKSYKRKKMMYNWRGNEYNSFATVKEEMRNALNERFNDLSHAFITLKKIDKSKEIEKIRSTAMELLDSIDIMASKDDIQKSLYNIKDILNYKISKLL
jgi:hypothetical protein